MQRKHKSIIACLTSVAVIAAFSMVANADNFTLGSGSNTAIINLPGIAGGSGVSAGAVGLNYLDRNNPSQGSTPVVDWLYDVRQQWLYASINGAPAVSIDTLGGGTLVSSSATSLRAKYGNGDVLFDVTYTLTGYDRGNFSSKIVRNVVVSAPIGSSKPVVDIYSYSDLNLTQLVNIGDHPDTVDSIIATGPTYVKQRDIQLAPSVTPVSEALDTVTPYNSMKVGKGGTATNSLIDKLTGFSGNVGGMVVDAPGSGTATDSAFVYQHTVDLKTQSTKIISETLQVTPEPASLVLLGVGGLLIMSRRNRRA